jgi:hypothetical protein
VCDISRPPTGEQSAKPVLFGVILCRSVVQVLFSG